MFTRPVNDKGRNSRPAPFEDRPKRFNLLRV